MAASKVTKVGILLLCMLSGLTIGKFVGELCSGVYFLKWINYSQVFGLNTPVQIDLGAMMLAFQIKFNISISGILGMIGGVLIYKKL